MPMCVFPRKPYDEVRSTFTRNEIRRGSFDDVAYRRYVNELVWLEWYTTDGLGPHVGGVSRFGASVHRWKIAAIIPEAYDSVRESLNAPTRDEIEWGWYGEEDPEERRRWAQHHREEWRAVQRGKQRSPETRDESGTGGHQSFVPFRFPTLSYETVRSPFIRELIRDGDFDDIEYRRYVNQLVWVEWYATDWERCSLYGPVLKNWKIAAEHPADFDIVRRELGEETRADSELSGEIYYNDNEAAHLARKHKRSWQAVQEAHHDRFWTPDGHEQRDTSH